MTSTDAIPSFLVAGLLGFLIGLEREGKRETHGSIFAGIRTFPLIALFGAIVGHLTPVVGPWGITAGLLALGGLLLLAYWRESSGEKVGGTTAVTALVAFGLGVLAGLGEYVSALAGAVITTGVLSFRQELRALSGGLSRSDLFAVVQFAAVSLVILPLVPNESYGPWEVWNPRSIWLLVVFISGVSFVGYVLSKLVSARRGIGLSGLIGGLASSTAVALSFGARSRSESGFSAMLAAGTLGATAVAMVRLVVLVGVVQPSLVLPALVPLGVYGLSSALIGVFLYRSGRDGSSEAASLGNPFELKTALTFALLFAAVLLVTKAAQVFFGSGGVYIASALAGLTQLDAIALTLAQGSGRDLTVDTAVKGLALALAANSAFKSVLAFSLGSARFGRTVTVTLFAAAALALAAAWWLPAGWLDSVVRAPATPR